MNEKNGPESFIDPSILADMTPEGRKLAKKVLESTDMVIQVAPTRQMKPDASPLHPVIRDLAEGMQIRDADNVLRIIHDQKAKD